MSKREDVIDTNKAPALNLCERLPENIVWIIRSYLCPVDVPPAMLPEIVRSEDVAYWLEENAPGIDLDKNTSFIEMSKFPNYYWCNWGIDAALTALYHLEPKIVEINFKGDYLLGEPVGEALDYVNGFINPCSMVLLNGIQMASARNE